MSNRYPTKLIDIEKGDSGNNEECFAAAAASEEHSDTMWLFGEPANLSCTKTSGHDASPPTNNYVHDIYKELEGDKASCCAAAVEYNVQAL